MRRATDRLSQEHRTIEALLDCFEALLDETHRLDRLDPGIAVELLASFREFAEGAHQEKEERLLFPALQARGGAERRLVATLLDGHRGDRRALETLGQGLEAAAYDDPFSRDLFVCRGRAYVARMREHVREEDEVLLPLARRVLDHDQERTLARAFERVDADRPRAAAEPQAGLAARLARRLGLEPNALPCRV